MEFEAIVGGVRLISARDAEGADILTDLEDLERLALASEILDDYREAMPTCEASLHVNSTVYQPISG
ncbi:hypothetical protein [Methylobacterium brachythecii]|uniref:Uncharacterized protein n=1 Tax=Methylobacterium brachythecii TaxID=1176177 RepID=A0A7W6AJ75_9HYPH|nr:hypothetical protein [Methylobacterium brachythecii]MBB3903673.1 hypothetical protein [Methylobacterium brachythecii]GLS44244.1 hypothetical protein GCM10007884_22320 [Methylobacterium brachythecii]